MKKKNQIEMSSERGANMLSKLYTVIDQSVFIKQLKQMKIKTRQYMERYIRDET